MSVSELEVRDAGGFVRTIDLNDPRPVTISALPLPNNAASSTDIDDLRNDVQDLLAKLNDVIITSSRPVTYTKVAGSPFTLSSSWNKVATVSSATRGLRIAGIAAATVFDIEWVAVAANSPAPTDTYGEPVFGGEDFVTGVPIGDVYLKSASGQIATVKIGT